MTSLKHLAFIGCFFCFLQPLLAQTPASIYKKKWSVVDSLIYQKGLIESAQAEVERIFTLAVKEHNDVQQIRALVYRLRLEERKSADLGPVAIKEMETSMEGVSQPAKAILQNILAGAYWNYYQENRDKILNRTNTIGLKKDDIATWSPADFRQRISELFRESLKDEQGLAQVRIDDYDPILIPGNARNLRPSLFDVLAHAALDYFMSGEQELDNPTNIFEITDPAAFADAATFASHRFATTNSADLRFLALRLYQHLILLHKDDSVPDALIDVDIRRLRFANENAIIDDKEEMYENALVQLTQRWGKAPVAAEAWYLLAELHERKAGHYSAQFDTSGRFEYIKARDICEYVAQEKDFSEGKSDCINLMKEILQKKLEIEVESVNVPGRPFRGLVTWRNIGTIYCHILAVDRATEEKINQFTYDDIACQKVARLPALRSFTQTLPETDDCREHRTEIRLDGLQIGDYAILVSTDPAFNVKKNSTEPLAIVRFRVSGISYIKDNNDYFVLKRESGHPLVGATIEVWQNHLNQQTGRMMKTRAEHFRTDDQGHFLLRKRLVPEFGQSMELEIRAGDDHLYSTQYEYDLSLSVEDPASTTKERYEREHREAFLFTDRSIYRPGQNLFFKGIELFRDADTKRLRVLKKNSERVYLYDVNQNAVDSVEGVTNDLGSYHGQLKIP